MLPAEHPVEETRSIICRARRNVQGDILLVHLNTSNLVPARCRDHAHGLGDVVPKGSGPTDTHKEPRYAFGILHARPQRNSTADCNVQNFPYTRPAGAESEAWVGNQRRLAPQEGLGVVHGYTHRRECAGFDHGGEQGEKGDDGGCERK